MSTKSAVFWTIFWIFTAGLIGLYIGAQYSPEDAMEFYAVYLIEKTLSFDNLFVFFLIFSYFKTPDNLKQKILIYGIAGAIIFRAIFIFGGTILFEQFDWLLYILGAGLIYLGFKLFFGEEDGEEDVADMWAVKVCKKRLRFKDEYHGGELVTIGSYNNKLYFTLTFLVIVVIEISDIIFAIDSVPAAFAITNNGFIIYTANMCAILGLRSLYFVMDAFINRLKFINYGVGIILAFIGFKLLTKDYIHINPNHSMIGVLAVLGITFVVSVLFTKEEAKAS